MDFKQHFQLMVNYNLRMNAQMYDAANQLSASELIQDTGAFFKSILGTLNHIMVGDLLWLNRFALLHGQNTTRFTSLERLQEFPKPNTLDQILFDDFTKLHRARTELDLVIQAWLVDDACAQDFKLNLNYFNSKGEKSTRSFGELVSHLFNHQTHHRGQISTLLSQKGIDVGGTDFLMDIPTT